MFKKIKRVIKLHAPAMHKFIISSLYFKKPYYDFVHFIKVSKIRKKKHANVVFFISALGMWRYENIYMTLLNDERFNVFILIQPFGTYTEESQNEEVDKIKKYFKGKNISYIDMTDNPEEKIQWFHNLGADILFYPQPYYGMYANKLDPYYNRDKLFCYCPYGIVTLETPILYNEPFQNISWRLFYPTKYHLQDAQKYAFNKGNNVYVSGDLKAELTSSGSLYDPWKSTLPNRKKIIWAPHFTISGNSILERGSFLWLNEYMKELVLNHRDQIQIAFKPHPRLKSELYRHPDWGKIKTDNYYEFWHSIENGQLEEGDYSGLFYYSDALIHDCGSFSAEYLYVNKPCIFTAKNIKNTLAGLNSFGKECISLHYIGTCEEEVDKLLERIVFNNDDIYRERRTRFINDILIPNQGINCTEFIYHNILRGLGF